MQHIKKTGTPQEEEGKRITKEYIDNCWCEETNQYNNLCYDRSKIQALGSILLDEQADSCGNSYCCYCMRKLFLTDTADNHRRNVTYEHIIPHKIKSREWEKDKNQYIQFPNLNEEHITICFNGTLTQEQKETKITDTPYPHFVSYHNLVASCDGSTFEGSKLQTSHCCNNQRQERFVMPIYLSKEWSEGIQYTNNGELNYDDTLYDYHWFDENHLRLTNAWITLVRKIWYRVALSDYTVQDIETARSDKDLRQNIIDDVDTDNEISSWYANDAAWNLFSEYSWFYQYYKNKP